MAGSLLLRAPIFHPLTFKHGTGPMGEFDEANQKECLLQQITF